MPARLITVLLTMIGALFGAVGLGVITTTPAAADLVGGSMRHDANDAGRATPIYVEFANGDKDYLLKGDHSDHIQPDGYEDVDRFYVNAGEEIWRWHSSPKGHWEKAADATGWEDLGNLSNHIYEVRVD